MVAFFNWFLKITAFLPYWLVFRPKYYYENKKVQSRRIKKGAIVISNHHSVWDFAVTLFTFPFRNLRCAAAEILFERNIFLKLFLKSLGAVKVDRRDHNFSFLSILEREVRKNRVVEIYPESRISRPEESTPLEFKPSAVYLALRTGAPIIPICNNAKYFSKSRVRVIIGEPIYVQSLYDENLTERENIVIINDIIRGKIIEFQRQLESYEKKEKEEKGI